MKRLVLLVCVVAAVPSALATCGGGDDAPGLDGDGNVGDGTGQGSDGGPAGQLDAQAPPVDAPVDDPPGPDAAVADMPDAAVADMPDAQGPDADVADAAPPTCSFGEAESEATADNPSLFGNPVPFAGGAELPAGTYEATYIDGCFKFAGNQGWTVNADVSKPLRWVIIDGTEPGAPALVTLPGNEGIFAGQGGHADFDDCVAASAMEPPVTFVHDGGPLAIRLLDTNYPDNVAGPDGRNPRWRLELQGSCEPDAGM